MDSDGSPSLLDPIEKLADDYLERMRRGERPTPADYAARYPELAGRILELFPALELLEGLKPRPEDHTGPRNDVASGLAPAAGLRAQRMGDYTLLRELGRGGMGIVYEAQHESLKNRVALKVMHARFRADRAYLRRFQTEARSAARLHHTNIVPVFDYGEEDGVCYYAMQCIDGIALDRVLDDVRGLRDREAGASHAATDRQGAPAPTEPADDPILSLSRSLLAGRFATRLPTPGESAGVPISTLEIAPPEPTSYMDAPAGLPTDPAVTNVAGSSTSSLASQPEAAYFREIARLGAQIADALDYAHGQNVVHRDIKSSNLLLDAYGNAWVTDFGLAKLVEGGDLSQSHDLAGTLRFMAPERFRGVTDRRSDIYALGATLYELLTLKPAFDETDQVKLMNQIAREQPPPLRHHEPRIPRDLETIVLKALAKDPADRCATAGELRDELRRFLEGRPTRWRRVGPIESFRRWCKRNRGLAVATVSAALLCALLAIGSTIAAWRFRLDRVRIQNAQRETQRNLHDSRMNLFESLVAQAQARRFSRRVGQRFESLRALEQAVAIARDLKLPPHEFDRLRDEAIACLALPDLKKTDLVLRRPPEVLRIAFDSAMARYAFRFKDGTIQVRRVADGAEIARFQGRGDRDVNVFCFSPDGRYLAATHSPEFALTVWNVDQNRVALHDPGPVITWSAAQFSADSQRIAVSRHDGDVVIYELENRRDPARWRLPHPGHLAFRGDGAQIAVVEAEPQHPACHLLDAKSGRVVRSIALPSVAGACAWSPDGATLGTACLDNKIYLWDAASGTRRATIEGHTNAGLSVAFHPAGTLLASNGWEHHLRLWDTVLGRPVLSLSADNYYFPAGFSRDGRIVVSLEDQLTGYEVEPALAYQTFAHAFDEPVRYWRASIRRDGRVLALGTQQGVALWDPARGTELAFLPIGFVRYPLFEASGDLLTAMSGPPGVQRWPVRVDRDRGKISVGPPQRLPFPLGNYGGLAEDRSGRIVAVSEHSDTRVVTPAGVLQVGPLDDCRYVAVSPDGQWLATGSHGQNGAQVWRIADGKRVADLKVEGLVGVAFSPDGKWLLTSPSPCRLWAVGTWKEHLRTSGEGYEFTPDGRLLVVQEANKILRLVETETGRTVARLETPDSCPLAQEGVNFSPDGSRLVMVTNDGPAVHVWDLRAIRMYLARLGLDWDAPPYAETNAASATTPTLR